MLQNNEGAENPIPQSGCEKMKCIECRKGDMELIEYRAIKNALGKTKGIMVCNYCGHKERFL